MSIAGYRVEGLGKRMKELREKKGIKQEELAKTAHIGRSSIGCYEIGRMAPTYVNLIRLADSLNVSTDYLLGYDADGYLDLSGIDEKQREYIYKLYKVLSGG
ncbi:MAG TPA: XRE family transcriptional regulator [Lachnospiraceae bacterium]|nr:XRE family transcriptional regulator [Lachnospiraceae bacterium]